MRILIILVIVSIIAFSSGGCKSSSKSNSFCDTTCLTDTIKFSNNSHPLRPYVYISTKNCNADTLIWSYDGMGVNRKMNLDDLLGTDVKLNRKFIRCVINDTSYAWLMFNDCSDGRGYLLKLPFNKKKSIGRKSSAINSLDPKFSVADGLAAYTDRGNIFIEEIKTGKTAMMTFGKMVDIDYDVIHKSIDSVNVTPARVWVKIKIDNEWKTLEKNITLQ